ncbi:MAG TPA: extracellular solute-binding protein [Candidatus Avipropionibacterium avicola]|uniref:Extracellular solute-binding protein n=1 Tax=Candidatus Avipropionibacterium avicola TaxID=2840701 RepID=A0A9D1GXK4_9ACTN|nr:extracellular solute-binding protein [Candidatus Avipropionibacterium avicola]
MENLSRRAVLGAGAAAAATWGLASCRTNNQPSGREAAEQNANVVLPSYVPVELIEPDLPGSEEVLPGYFAYPRDPQKAIETPPGEGLDSIEMMYITFLPSPGSAAKNSFWGQLQEDIGTTVKLTPISSGDYGDKFQTMVAGGQLPDIMNMPSGSVPDQPQMMEKLFADLGPMLSGDAAKEFPFLANIPSFSWRGCKANGTIQAIPQHRSKTGDVLFYRADIFAEKGLNPEPQTWDEFIEVLEGLTDRAKGTFAFSNVGKMHNRLIKMMGGPNSWSESGGVFTSAFDDPTYRESLAMMPDLVKKYAHPDSPSATYAQFREFFYAGYTGLLDDGAAGWDLYVRSLKSADKLGMMRPPKYEGGGQAPNFAGKGYQGITVINKKLEGDKLRAALNVLNFLAAPIGSQEHLRRKFGVEGQDWEWDGDLPSLTDAGQQSFIDLQYIVDSPLTLGPGPQGEVETQYEWHSEDSKNLIEDPTIGLYSDTSARKSGTVGREIGDVVTGIYYGRNSLEDFDKALEKWHKAGGDKIAEEYGEALATEPPD